MKDQIIDDSSEEKSLAYFHTLHKLIVDMDLIIEKVIRVEERLGLKEKQPTYSVSAASSRGVTTGKTNSMVGFDDELIQLMDLLTSQQDDRIIISIVGMGGIGKTTLAQNAFEHLLIKQHFDLCLWATISQKYSLREIILQLLSFMQGKFISETVDELGEQLYKRLWGRRYLIVLDDIWSIDVWDKIKNFFPNNEERSRVAITTRLLNVATHYNSSCIMIKFLDEDQSWKLLSEKTFGEEECPQELEEIGKEIVKKCKGLPLSLVVIGGHLRNSLRTKEYWVEVAYGLNSVLDYGENEQHLSILSLSYSHLPTHLKPCFLYIGVSWEEDAVIRVSTLVKLWVAKGFLKKSEAQSPEEVAEVYLKDLVHRNLILVHRLKQSGRLYTCKIHDLLRELCILVAEREKFHCVLKLPPQYLKSCSFDFTLLKIQLVHIVTIEDEFGVVYLGTDPQVCLRYLKSTIYFSKSFYSKPTSCIYLHPSIFQLWNLQTLIINVQENVRIMGPPEILRMPNLRHLLVWSGICIPTPSSDRYDHFSSHNLQTLLNVENFQLSEEVCRRIPNIKRLQLYYDEEASSSSYYCLHNLCCFKQLKSLTCDFAEMSNWHDSALNLPRSLLKLSLRSRYLNWKDLAMIATLVPHLEVLKLKFLGSNMGQFKGEFPCLKSLTTNCSNDFTEWNADKSHFPVIDNFTLIGYRLTEIPSSIGEIPTLGAIDLIDCSASAAVSAVRMVVEQEEFGDQGFQLQLHFWSQSDEERFWEMVQEEDLTSNNVLVKNSFRTNTTFRMKSRP